MSKSSFKERQSALRQEYILSAARRLFAEKGFRGTNLNAVAAEVGIARGTIYLHFPTKEHLLKAIISSAEQELLATLKQAFRPEDSPVIKLRKLLTALMNTYCEYEDLIRVMSQDLRRGIAPKIYERNQPSPLLTMVQEIIDEGKARGQINPCVHTQVAAHALFSLVTIDSFRNLSEQLSPREIADSALEIYIHGITGGDRHAE